MTFADGAYWLVSALVAGSVIGFFAVLTRVRG